MFSKWAGMSVQAKIDHEYFKRALSDHINV